MKTKITDYQINIEKAKKVSFNNNVDFCVGTGRMGLALQAEYLKQLDLVQKYIGFKHIRGHGLFCDDMAVYQKRTDRKTGEVTVEYNFTYIDMVMDSYLERGLESFLELGFMPYAMASGDQTVFYWKGNVTPPADYKEWKKMVQALLRHLMSRYGTDRVVTWPVEVWNEPNLTVFWKDADMAEYFKLFKETFYAVKAVDSRFRVGGPAVCGGTDEKWISAFMDFCAKEKIPVDFVTRHHYTTEFPEPAGHYGYAELQNDEAGFANLKTTRKIIDSHKEYKGLQIHITEFNTSYIPNCPLHDTNQNAAYIAKQLSRLGDGNESYSYWTFGDIFEEQGVPFTPFHGGFGLVANGCIPKPTFWTFAFFKSLKEKPSTCIYRDDFSVIVKTDEGEYRGVLFNRVNHRGDAGTMNVKISLPSKGGTADEKYSLVTKRVDEETCNPLKFWHDLGEPANPSRDQLELLRMSAYPQLASSLLSEKTFEIMLPENAVVYFELKSCRVDSDRGYDYNRVMQIK